MFPRVYPSMPPRGLRGCVDGIYDSLKESDIGVRADKQVRRRNEQGVDGTAKAKRPGVYWPSCYGMWPTPARARRGDRPSDGAPRITNQPRSWSPL